MTILGVDYSHWQAGVDPLKLIAGGVSFVIVKSGEWYGEDEYDDDRYTANMTALGEAQLPHGSYYFYHPKIGNSKQLRHWQRLWESQPHDFPPILDCETQDGMFRWDYDTETAGKIALQVRIMLEGMARISGRQPIVYTTASWWSYYAGDPAFGAEYPFWLAQYNTSMTRCTATIKPNIIMWQFTDKLAIPGCPTMDGNYWMGTEAEFYSMIDKNDGTVPYQVEQIAENRIKKNIFALSRKNRQWLERMTR